MKLLRVGLAAVAVSCGAGVRAGVTYYVDGTIGDDARASAVEATAPWRTVQHAAEAAQPGDTVLVFPGTYRETVTPVRGGTAEAPIVFRAADPARRPVISGAEFVNAGPWEGVEITDFRGNRHKVWRTTVERVPAMLHQGGRRMLLAQEPNQTDPNDPYDLKNFREVPSPTSDRSLTDPEFLVQSGKDYWTGATLLLWDSFPNAIGEYPVTGYDPAGHALQVEPLAQPAIGSTEKETPDRYALRGHIGILDQPGEYFVDASVIPHQLYVWPYEGVPVVTVEATARDNGIAFSRGREWVVFDGFIVRDCADEGITVRGRENRFLTFRNCDLVANMGSGLGGRFVSDITVEHCLMRDNYANGISFANCQRVRILGCEVTANGDNGIWFGSGQPGPWNSSDILVRGCHLHHAAGRRRHPDNFQMHQVRDVTLDGNVFVQAGDQNMWCQYSDGFVLRNNVFVGGALGINSSISNTVVHNAFWNSTLRYDRHLDNHPQNKDFYKPQSVTIRNNAILESGIAWPDAALVDRFKVFTVDHNYYALGGAQARSTWEWRGRVVSPAADSILVADQVLPADGSTVEVTASTTWSEPARLVLLYQDPDNLYWLGLGSKSGFWRRTDGQDACLAPDPKGLLRLPHQGGATATYRIVSSRVGDTLRFVVTRHGDGGDSDVAVEDTDAAAVGRFARGRFGFWSGVRASWCALVDVRLTTGGETWHDDFADADLGRAAGPDELTWQVVRGAAPLRNRGGNGVGFGEGSLVVTNLAAVASAFRTLPDQHGSGFDFRPTAGSPLIDAGLDVGVRDTFDGQPRPAGTVPDIGPFEAAGGR